MNEENCQKCQIPDLRQLRQRLLGRGEALKGPSTKLTRLKAMMILRVARTKNDFRSSFFT